MPEPGWTHLDPSDLDPDADPNAEAEDTGYAIEESALEARSTSSEEETDDTEEVGSSFAARAQAIAAGVGKGASLGLQAVGRMNPRTRIGVASGLSVLALAGAMFTRGSGSGKPAPPAQIAAEPTTTQKTEEQTSTPKAKQDELDAMKAEQVKAEKEALAAKTTAATPAPEDKKAGPEKNIAPADPLQEKPPALDALPDPSTVLAANSDSKDKSGFDLPLPSPAGPQDPAPKPTAEPPLPPISSPSQPTDQKPSGDGKTAPLPGADPATPVTGEVSPAPAPGSSSALSAIGDDLDKLPAQPKPAAAQTQPVTEPSLPGGASHPGDTPKGEPEKKDPGKQNPDQPNPAAGGAPEVIAIPPVAEKPLDTALPPTGNTQPPTPTGNTPRPTPTIPETGNSEPKVESQPSSAPVASSSPSVSIPEPTAAAPSDLAKPQPELAPSAPPKELPKTAIEAAAGALAVGGTAAAATETAAIPPHDKIPPDTKTEAAASEAIPIRNTRASLPRDLNSAEDPRGDESQDLFDSGADTSAVTPTPANAQATDKERQFEVEAPAPKTRGRVVQAEPEPKPDRVEAAYHRVEKEENFWTISRLYYGSGRYYKALWAANRDTVPVIDQLREKQVIVIPAQEDLDGSLIEPARVARATASGASQSASARTNTRNPKSADRSPRRSLAASGIDSIADDDDENFAARGRSKGRSSARERDIDDGLDRVSDTTRDRTADLPIHKVRQNETLRSIARDRLGDSKRANEILRLNRGVIEDPSNLVAGQVIELPEDAKPGRR